MKKLMLVCLLAAPAFAQVHVAVEVPTIRFATRPTLVEVAPGVQVVPDNEEEVYFTDGYYWHHRGPNWYRTREYSGGWELAEPRYVPRTIVSYEPGRYRRWHAEERREVKQEVRKEERHEQRKEERKEHHEHRE